MKKIILVLLLLTGFTTLTKAQDTTKVKKTPEERVAQITKIMQKKLSLTADQTTQISAILTDRATKISEPKTKGGKLAKMEAMADADKKINAILTPVQQKLYAQMEENTKEKAMERKQAKIAGPITPVTPPAQ